MTARHLPLFCSLLIAACTALPAGAPRPPVVRYEPTPHDVVQAMVRLAEVRAGDVVYDLGCGDGRIVIAAARLGARGVCVDIDPERIAESRANAAAAGVTERIEFRNEDLLRTPLHDATVVMLFLSLEMNRQLRPRLLRELKPGARIVSHWHGMDNWRPQATVHVRSDWRDHAVFLWTVPPR